jgi:hypothetical protein
MNKFNETLQEDSDKYGLNIKKDYIIGEPNKHYIEGIYEVEYQIPSLKRSESDKSIFEPITDTNGNVVGKRVNDPKTVYDPIIILSLTKKCITGEKQLWSHRYRLET